MAWEGLKTWTAGAVATAADFIKYLNNNLSYLLTPNKFSVLENTGTYSASVTSLANVGSSFAVSLTTYGGHVHIHVQGVVSVSSTGSGYAVLALNLDGTQIELFTSANGSADYRGWFNFDYLWSPAAGAHTIALQWKVINTSGVATATITKSYSPLLMWGIER